MSLTLQQLVDVERRKLSLTEFAEQFEALLNEKNELKARLTKALDDVAARTKLYHQALDHFDTERNTLKAQIENLTAKLKEYTAVDGEKSVIALKERLIRDEFERKVQELSLQAKRERAKIEQQVHFLKKQLASCICRASGKH